MRLWHYKLLPYLPDKWIIDQWRSLVAIKRVWHKEDMQMPLCDYVRKYCLLMFYDYTKEVMEIMHNRGIKYNKRLYEEITGWCIDGLIERTPEVLRYPEHNEEYLEICYFNLKEKYLRGILSREEWQKIVKFYKEM